MAMVRCSKCNAPMTGDEAATGTCPDCGAAVERTKPASAGDATHTSAPPPSAWRSLLIAVVGGVLFLLLPIIMLFYSSMPERTEKKEEQKVAQIKKTPTPEKKVVQPEKKSQPDSTAKKDEESSAKSKTVEAKSTEPAKKTDEPKIDVKKEEPKKVEVVKKAPEEVKPAPQKFPAPVRHAGNLVLPLLGDDVIKIDGSLADWREVPPLLLNAVERGRSPKRVVMAPPTQKAYLAYSSKGILVGVDIVDTSGELENVGRPATGLWNFWDNDGVEIYIDTMNLRSPRRGPPSIHQFFAMPFGTSNDNGVGGYESKIIANPLRGNDWTIEALPATGRNAMLRAGKKTPSGWSLEFLIPRSALRANDARPGQVFALEVQIDTGTNIYYFWANDNPAVHVSTTPSAWGEVILGGTDARLETLNAKSEPIKAVNVGDDLVIRVTDRDANFDGDAKGKLSISLRSSSGDIKPLVLTETEAGSGTFVGTINTVRKDSRRNADQLEVVPNGSITLEYLDRVRANGDRNIVLRSELPVR